jgi:hypothetical protein
MQLKAALNEIVKNLEHVMVEIVALEEALIAREVVSLAEIESHKAFLSPAHTNAKHMLVNVRHAISQLPE